VPALSAAVSRVQQAGSLELGRALRSLTKSSTNSPKVVKPLADLWDISPVGLKLWPTIQASLYFGMRAVGSDEAEHDRHRNLEAKPQSQSGPLAPIHRATPRRPSECGPIGVDGAW